MEYINLEELISGFHQLNEEEETKAPTLIREASIIIDSFNSNVDISVKKIVCARMVRRALENSSVNYPIGANQGSISALGYSQSWTISNGSSGEIYLSKAEKNMLGLGNKIGSRSPLEDL